jgi:hypothetical protein
VRSVVFVVALSQGCFEEHHGQCLTLCSDYATVVATTKVQASALAFATITVCVNPKVCTSLTLQTEAFGVAKGNFDAQIDVGPGSDGNAVVTISVDDTAREFWFRDGDVWSVAITDPSGGVLFAATAAATYTITAPGCDGRACHVLSLDLS